MGTFSLATLVYSVAILGPLMLLFGPWLAGRLSESPLTTHYTTFALYTIPLACLSGAFFLLCRPVFEALQQGRPGLLMAALRYLVLTAPLAWLGMRTAAHLGQPELYGLIAGTLAAAALPSAAFYLWLRVVLREAEEREAARP